MPETAVIIVITLLSRIGKTAKPALEKALGDPDQAVQKAAQRALKGLK
jgi:HEAT repeat protein